MAKMRDLLLQILWTLSYIARGGATCTMADDTCEFWLEVEQQLTMMDYKTAVYPANGLLYKYDVTNVTAAEPIAISKVITADGWEKTRLVITVNKTMPGPPIEVYEDQTVIVHVKNRLTSMVVTIHWHGLHQQGTPWMDGVAFVTQCPILPGQSFAYKFKASPKGTSWYHAHIGSQLSMGLLGPLIVREKVPPPMEEFIMMLQDWNHDLDGDLIHLRMVYGNYENRTKVSPTVSLEGGYFSMFPFHSGLINGRGRFYYQDRTHNQAPLTVFTVQQSKSYKFRVIGGGSLYPFRVSVDNHRIKVVASDGYDLQPVYVESFIINPGERVDFEIIANQLIQNYWIHAETLEVNETHIAQAILRYEGASNEEPTTVRKKCTQNDRCLVVNCPFSYYPEGTFTDCKLIGDLKAVEGNSTPGAKEDFHEKIQDIFLNFAFPGTTWTPGSVNGHAYQTPSVSALTQPHEINTQCNPKECGQDKICQCTYSLDLEHNKVYQMVFLNMGAGRGWAHPVHMHGHSFHVVKVGYPIYNHTTGKFVGENLDIDCGGHLNRSKSFCNSAKWANATWGGNNIPGLELESPPRKDTIMVPTGGYVVVRIQADNPGLWFIHCHIELHMLDGMAMVINESYPYHPSPPDGFPKCGSFHNDDTKVRLNKDNKGNEAEFYNNQLFWIVNGCLIAVVTLQFIIILVMCCRCQLFQTGNFNISAIYYNRAYNGPSIQGIDHAMDRVYNGK